MYHIVRWPGKDIQMYCGLDSALFIGCLLHVPPLPLLTSKPSTQPATGGLKSNIKRFVNINISLITFHEKNRHARDTAYLASIHMHNTNHAYIVPTALSHTIISASSPTPSTSPPAPSALPYSRPPQATPAGSYPAPGSETYHRDSSAGQ